MRKNGSRQLSAKQYKLTDLFVFAVILILGELFPHFALEWFPQQAFFTLSFMVPIVVIIMIRWGWPSVFYAVAGGIIYCLLNSGDGINYATYGIGNAFIALMLIPYYLIGEEKITSRWWASLLFVFGAWVCVYLGRAVVSSIALTISPIEGVNPISGFVSFAMTDTLSLAIGIVIILVIRRFDGMFEGQKRFLNRIDAERKEEQRKAAFGEEIPEIDEEALEILDRTNDLYD